MLSLRYVSVILFSFMLLLSFTGCGGGTELVSNWADNPISIDGNVNDWNGSLQYLPDNNAAIGFKNDDKSLYLCLQVNDASKVVPMLRRGFTIWIEPGESDKKLGIKYPLHDMMNDNGAFRESAREAMEMRDAEKIITEMISKQDEIQIVNKDNFPLTLIPLDNKEGIEAKLAYNNDVIIYELKLPLEPENYQYKIAAVPGEKLTLSFETSEINRDSFRRNMGEGGGMRPGGGQMPGGEGMPGGRGGRPGGAGGMMRNIEPLNFEVVVTLEKK